MKIATYSAAGKEVGEKNEGFSKLIEFNFYYNFNFGINAARCSAVALVSMQATRLSPAPTRRAAEPTIGPIIAAVSTDSDPNRPLCLVPACGGLAAASERLAQPDAMQWLWFRCRPLSYRRHRLAVQLSRP